MSSPLLSPAPFSNRPLLTEMHRSAPEHKVFKNLWWHGHRFYALQGPDQMENSTLEEGLTTNTAIIRLPVSAAPSFASNLRAGYLPGVTLMVDFPFPAFTDHLGHWAEILMPVFSMLSGGGWSQGLQGNTSGDGPVARLQRGGAGGAITKRGKPAQGAQALTHRRVMTTSCDSPVRGGRAAHMLSRAGGRAVPPWLGSRDACIRTRRPHAALPPHRLCGVVTGQLPGSRPAEWRSLLLSDARTSLSGDLCAEELPQTPPDACRKRPTGRTYTHPKRLTGFIGSDHGDLWRYDKCERYVSSELGSGFQTQELGTTFRESAYARANLPAPSPWTPGQPPPLPRHLTYLSHHDSYPGIVNEAELVAALYPLAREFGLRLRPASLSTDAPYASHVETFADSAVVVGKHGPLFASAVLLPPGALVVELLPYKWEWQGVSRLFYNMTQSMGDIHHHAWRPMEREWCANPRILAGENHTGVHVEEFVGMYHTWNPVECHARECLLVHAKARLIVDIPAVTALLRQLLPGVLAGNSVQSMSQPWPPVA
ncbi:MAG: hypothetical protein WDW38_000318 [Sanguina aurantia]